MNTNLIKYIKEALKEPASKLLLQKKYFEVDSESFNNSFLYGHCYIASEVYYHASNEKFRLKPYFIKHLGCSHWFLKEIDTNIIIDITSEQFKIPVNYSQGTGKGFLTKGISKRGMELYNLIKLKGF